METAKEAKENSLLASPVRDYVALARPRWAERSPGFGPRIRSAIQTLLAARSSLRGLGRADFLSCFCFLFRFLPPGRKLLCQEDSALFLLRPRRRRPAPALGSTDLPAPPCGPRPSGPGPSFLMPQRLWAPRTARGNNPREQRARAEACPRPGPQASPAR